VCVYEDLHCSPPVHAPVYLSGLAPRVIQEKRLLPSTGPPGEPVPSWHRAALISTAVSRLSGGASAKLGLFARSWELSSNAMPSRHQVFGHPGHRASQTEARVRSDYGTDDLIMVEESEIHPLLRAAQDFRHA